MVGVTGRLVICSLLLCSFVVPVGPAAAAGLAPPSPGADTTVTRIDVAANGSATWTIQIRTRLETDQEVEEYRAFQRRFRENTSRYLGTFRDSIRGVVANAANATGRSMRATGFAASTSIQQVPRRWGIVTYEFRWAGFAAQQNDRLLVGDIFQGGFFIAENDSLEVVAPDGYRIATVDPAADEQSDGAVTWTGREDFADERPRVVLAPAATAPTGTPGTTPTDRGLPVGIAVIGLLALAGGAAVVGYRKWGRTGGEPSTDGDVREAGQTPNTEGEPRTGGEGAVTKSAQSAEEPESSGEEAGQGEALLSDEDRVRRLLADKGGRMRQKEIGDELDWSKSKVSRVLSRMEEEDEIGKLRLGRENVIELEGEED